MRNSRTRMTFRTPREEALWATVKSMPSDQIARVFDKYLELMLEPVAIYTDVLYEGIAEALVLLTNQRRKITNADRDKTIAKLFAAMAAERNEMAKTVLGIGIERNILLDVIHTVLTDDNLTIRIVDLEPLRRHLHLLLQDLSFFRAMVFNRYMPLITKQSSSFAWGRRQNGLVVEDADAAQNYAMASMRALDKFDAESGTLTTYMGNWLRSAGHSIYNIHLGEAYSITRGVRSKMYHGEVDFNNHAISIHGNATAETVTPDQPDEQDERFVELLRETTSILAATGLIDQFRLALISVRANYQLSPEEIRLQAATLKETDNG